MGCRKFPASMGWTRRANLYVRTSRGKRERECLESRPDAPVSRK
jgi:hypothetical protein